VGASVPYARLTRYFLRQTIDLPGETEKVEGDINQFAGSRGSNRLVFTVGKFSVGDVFDNLSTAHDARRDFMNWSVIDHGSFDYAADAFGFTYGATAEWYQGDWTIRGGVFDMSIVPNSAQLDPTFQQFQWIGEIEHRHQLWASPPYPRHGLPQSRPNGSIRRRRPTGRTHRRPREHRSRSPLQRRGGSMSASNSS
jgi:high affinity Mn2+ porin